MSAHKVHAHEVYVREVHAYEVHAYHEVHAYEMHACEMQVYEVHAHEVYAREVVGYRPQALLATMEPKSDVRWLRSTLGYLLVPLMVQLGSRPVLCASPLSASQPHPSL